jgi:hypothetical protein
LVELQKHLLAEAAAELPQQLLEQAEREVEALVESLDLLTE